MGERHANLQTAMPIAALALLIAGVVNCFLLQPTRIFKRPQLVQWLGLIVLKFLLFLLFSPLFGQLITAFGVDYIKLRPCINGGLVVITLTASAIAKQVRETATSQGDS